MQDLVQELNIPPSPQPSPASERGGNREKHNLTVGIIGGGYAGMAAAVTLAQRGVPVTVYESARQLGGRARGVAVHDLQLDNGQHILLGCYRETLRLIDFVGGNVEQDFLRLPLQLTLHPDFELMTTDLPAPWHLLAGLFHARGLTFRQLLAAIRFMLAMRRKKFRLPRDMSVIELLGAYQQDEPSRRQLWEPICIAALNTPARKASAQVFLNVLRDSLNGARSDSDMLLPRIDLGALFPVRAAAYLERCNGRVHASCPVERLSIVDAGLELTTAEGTRHHSHVICAASPSASARLFRGLPQLAHTANRISSISFQPIHTVYLQYPAHIGLSQPMLGFDRLITQWVFDKGRIAGQQGLLAAVISAEGHHQEMEHAQLARKVAQELAEQLGIDSAPLWHKVIEEKRATFSCEPNLSRPSHVTPVDRLLLAGDFTAGDYPATLEGAVLSGIRCAEAVLAG